MANEAPMNEFLVSVRGSDVVVMRPPREPLSKERALALAAWIVVLAGGSKEEFESTVDAVMSS